MNYLNEVYFGKEYIAPLQVLLSTIRKKFANKPYSLTMNTDKDVLQFNRLAEKIFGFETFSLNLSPDLNINAYCIPIGIYRTKDQQKKLAQSLRASKGGFRFDPTMGQISATCTLNMGLLNEDRMSDSEIMAIMLHEIGHTFFEAVTDKECIYTLNNCFIDILKRINLKITQRISHGEDVSASKAYDDVKESLKGYFVNFKAALIKPISFIRRLFKHESMEDNMSKTMLMYTNEKFADSFASAYGYGVELHTALLKCDDIYIKAYNIKQSKNPVIVSLSVMYLLRQDLNDYVKGVKDEHPDGLARVKVTADYLKKELSKQSLDPKLKIQLLSQLEQINKLIDDYINFPKDEDNIKIVRTYYTILYNEFGGDRREQDADNDALFDTIDKRYNELMKEG